MVRRYQESIEVRAGEGVGGLRDHGRRDSGSGDPGSGDSGDIGRGGGLDVQDPSPTAFLWRGRLYIVREVIAHWRERRAWWRDALDPDEEVAAHGLDCLEHEVWRVEASPGRLAGIGVYDLGQDGAPGKNGSARGWRLLRVAD